MLVFCFLTYHDIQPISYWNHFFQNIDHNEFKVIIHPKLQINSSIYSFPIQCVQKRIQTISKSHISIVNATLQLLREAYNVTENENDTHFIFCSQHCIYFRNVECPDEHYFINILRFILKKDIIISQTHFCNFDLTKTQALTFKNINESMLKKIKSLGFLFMRKVT